MKRLLHLVWKTGAVLMALGVTTTLVSPESLEGQGDTGLCAQCLLGCVYSENPTQYSWCEDDPAAGGCWMYSGWCGGVGLVEADPFAPGVEDGAYLYPAGVLGSFRVAFIPCSVNADGLIAPIRSANTEEEGNPGSIDGALVASARESLSPWTK